MAEKIVIMVPPPPRSQAKPTYRADLLQEPEHAAHHHGWQDVSKRLIAGGIAGSLAKTVIAPLDRTKIIFQTSEKIFSARNAVAEMIHICKVEGVSGLWRGNSATVLRVFPYAGIQFCAFDLYKKMFSESGHLSEIQRLGAGSAAGATAVALTYPLDLLRARLAVRRQISGKQVTYLEVLKAGESQVHIRNLYRGLSPTLLGILPYAGIAFYTRDTLNSLAAKHFETTSLNTPLSTKLASGAISGLIAQSSTYPLDLVRRRMQTEGFVDSASRGNEARQDVTGRTRLRYVSIVGTLKTIYCEGGLKGLFKGLSMNWVKGPAAFMISFTAFDYLKLFFHISSHEDFRKKPAGEREAKTESA